MTHHMIRLLVGLPLTLAAASQVAHGQLPERTRPVPVTPPSDPTVAPQLPVADPRLGTVPQVVQPGTIQRDPSLVPLRRLEYLPAGEAPAHLQATASGPRSVTLSWEAPAGAAGYWVHQAASGKMTYYRGGSLVTEPTTTINGLLPGTTYSFKVSAVYPQEMQRAEGMSEPVDGATGPAPAPAGLTASVVGPGRVRLRWDALPEADGFRVSRNGAVVANVKRTPLSQGLATTADDSVPVGTQLYQVQAVFVVGYGPDQGAEALSALAPTPAVSVTIQAGTKVRYCQTRAGAARCAPPVGSSVTLAANAVARTVGRTP